MSRLTHIDLFTGIAGNTLAAQSVGFTTVAFSEIESFPCEILSLRYPNIPNLGDITKINEAQLEPFRGRTTLITTGSPCQDISAAGKGQGIAGEKSRLWFNALRIIATVLPRWVVVENSPLLRIRGADTICEGMEGLGYTCWPLVVGACNAGAPHRRQRAFIICYQRTMDDTGCLGQYDYAETTPLEGREIRILGSTGIGGIEPGLGRDVDGLSCRLDEHQWPAEKNQYQYPWEPPRIGPLIPDRAKRLKALGNAVVPQQVRPIFKMIAEIECQEFEPDGWN